MLYETEDRPDEIGQQEGAKDNADARSDSPLMLQQRCGWSDEGEGGYEEL